MNQTFFSLTRLFFVERDKLSTGYSCLHQALKKMFSKQFLYTPLSLRPDEDRSNLSKACLFQQKTILLVRKTFDSKLSMATEREMVIIAPRLVLQHKAPALTVVVVKSQTLPRGRPSIGHIVIPYFRAWGKASNTYVPSMEYKLT